MSWVKDLNDNCGGIVSARSFKAGVKAITDADREQRRVDRAVKRVQNRRLATEAKLERLRELLRGISSSPANTTRWRIISHADANALGLGSMAVNTRTYLQAQLPDVSTVRSVIDEKGCGNEVPLKILVMYLAGATFNDIAKKIGGQPRKAHDLAFEGLRRFKELTA